jgi:hypothetical protein
MKVKAGLEKDVFFVEELHWKTGHVVEWAYVWNTEDEPGGRPSGGGPANATTIQVKVTDKHDPKDSDTITGLDDYGTNTFHNMVKVDIVPYITGFERQTSTKRSLQGWYSFYQGEPNIALKGFNLGSTSGVKVFLSSNGTDNDITSMSGGSVGYNGTTNRFYFTMPTAADSGRINVTVSNIEAHNHKSVHKNKSWNRESDEFTPGSTLWINKPHAHVWRTNGTDYIGGTNAPSAGLNHPGMALEYSGGSPGTLHGTWSVYGGANVYYGTNTGAGNALYSGIPGEPFNVADIGMYNGGGKNAANIGFSQLVDGRPYLIARVSFDAVSDSIAANTQMEDQKYGSNGRWQNIRLSQQDANNNVAEGQGGRIYMTAYDADFQGLWLGTRKGTDKTSMVIDGSRNTSQNPGMITATGLTAAKSAGEFSAVDYDSTGPIIAYYDQEHDTVRVALGTNNPPSSWSRSYLLPEGHALRGGSGRYISIKVDRLNGIHLAFHNSVKNKVVYYYADGRARITTNGTAPNGSTVKVHTVDDVITGGTWTDISVRDNGLTGTAAEILPWIVYGDSSRTGNKDGVRVAYKSSAAIVTAPATTNTGIQFTGELKCPVTKADITGWEALTMPADHIVNNDRLNIEAWPPTVRPGQTVPDTTKSPSGGWNAAVGYASNMFRVGYFFYPAWKGYVD